MRYVWTAVFFSAALGACGSATAVEEKEGILDPIQISGAYAVHASVGILRTPRAQLRFSAIFVNRSTTSAQVEYGGCSVFLRLFRTAERTGAAVYDTSKQNLGCTLALHRLTIVPGDSVVIVHDYDVSSFFALAVPAGHYYADVLVAPNAIRTVVPAGEVDLQP